MTKNVLTQYLDAEKLIYQTERQLKRLIENEKGVLSDIAKGSNPEFPYQPVTFRLEGYGPAAYSDADVKKLKSILSDRRRRAAKLRLEVEAWVNTLPPRIQLIVQMKYLNRATWDEVSKKVGGDVTPDSIRMEWQRFVAELSEK